MTRVESAKRMPVDVCILRHRDMYSILYYSRSRHKSLPRLSSYIISVRLSANTLQRGPAKVQPRVDGSLHPCIEPTTLVDFQVGFEALNRPPVILGEECSDICNYTRNGEIIGESWLRKYRKPLIYGMKIQTSINAADTVLCSHAKSFARARLLLTFYIM